MLNPGEKIILEVRQHWYKIAVQAVITLILLLIPLIVFTLMLSNDQIATRGGLVLWSFLLTAWYLGVWTSFFVIWSDYYLDMWVVTNQRLINFEYKGLFSREVAECAIENIQDVSFNIDGVIQTLLHIGNISVQTAAEKRQFTLEHVGNPEEVKNLICEAQMNAKAKKATNAEVVATGTTPETNL
jgi:hypothetical protein